MIPLDDLFRKDDVGAGDVHVDAIIGAIAPFRPGPPSAWGPRKTRRRAKRASKWRRSQWAAFAEKPLRKDSQVPPYENGYGRWLKGHGTDAFGHDVLATNKHYQIFFLRKLWDPRYPIQDPEDLRVDPDIVWNPDVETGNYLVIGYDSKRHRAILVDGHHRLALAIQDGDTTDLPVQVVEKKVKKKVGKKPWKLNLPVDRETGMMKCADLYVDAASSVPMLPTFKAAHDVSEEARVSGGQQGGGEWTSTGSGTGSTSGSTSGSASGFSGAVKTVTKGSTRLSAYRVISADDLKAMQSGAPLPAGRANEERLGSGASFDLTPANVMHYVKPDQQQYLIRVELSNPKFKHQTRAGYPGIYSINTPITKDDVAAMAPLSGAVNDSDIKIPGLPGTGSLHDFVTATPQKSGEQSYVWQARLVDKLPEDLKNEVLFHLRERYAPVDYIAKGASQWRQMHGLPEPQQPIIEQRASEEKGQAVARAFDTATDESADPKVQAAYDDFKRQNAEMYDFMTKPTSEGGLGVKVDFTENSEPYNSATAQAEDLRANHHITIARHLGGHHEATMSDDEYNRFRAVHDTFGHAGIGGGFDRHGEYEAWLQHMSMYTGQGRDAMSSEYHGVNSSLWASKLVGMKYGGTGKSILLDPNMIQSPYDAKGNIVRKAQSDAQLDPQFDTEAIEYLIALFGLTPEWARWYETAPMHKPDPNSPVGKAATMLPIFKAAHDVSQEARVGSGQQGGGEWTSGGGGGGGSGGRTGDGKTLRERSADLIDNAQTGKPIEFMAWHRAPVDATQSILAHGLHPVSENSNGAAMGRGGYFSVLDESGLQAQNPKYHADRSGGPGVIASAIKGPVLQARVKLKNPLVLHPDASGAPWKELIQAAGGSTAIYAEQENLTRAAFNGTLASIDPKIPKEALAGKFASESYAWRTLLKRKGYDGIIYTAPADNYKVTNMWGSQAVVWDSDDPSKVMFEAPPPLAATYQKAAHQPPELVDFDTFITRLRLQSTPTPMIPITKGEAAGHPFRGNQYTGGMSNGDDSGKLASGETTGWHITDDPHFTPDPDRPADWNSLAGDLIPLDQRERGISVGDPEYWKNGHGYERPYVAEVAGTVNPDVSVYYPQHEKFMQGNLRTVRVVTLDEYAREKYHDAGWVEDYFGDKVPKIAADYKARTVAEMSPDEIERWEKRFAKYYARADGPHPGEKMTKGERRVTKAGHDVSGEARDDHGEWTDGAGGDLTKPEQQGARGPNPSPLPGRTRTTALIKSAIDNGGFTWHPATGSEPGSGYVVATGEPSLNVALTSANNTQRKQLRQAILQYLDDHDAEFKSNAALHLGGWWDKDAGQFVLDRVEVLDDKDKATKLGQQRDQKAIWDIANSAEIDTGGSGNYEQSEQLRKADAGSSPGGSGRAGGLGGPVVGRIDSRGWGYVRIDSDAPTDRQPERRSDHRSDTGTAGPAFGLIKVAHDVSTEARIGGGQHGGGEWTSGGGGSPALISPHTQQPEKAKGRAAARPDNPHATELSRLSPLLQQKLTKQVLEAGKLIGGRPLTKMNIIQNLRDLYDEAAASDKNAVTEGKTWYNNANHVSAGIEEAGGIDCNHAIGMLAALSPQAYWEENASMAKYLATKLHEDAPVALDADQLEHANTVALKSRNAKTLGFTPIRNGQKLSAMTPIQAAVAIKAVAQMVEQPTVAGSTTATGAERKYSWSTGLGNVTKAVRMWRGEEPNDVLSGHKVRSFFNNIADPDNKHGRGDVTMDTHAISAAVHARIAATSTILDKVFSIGNSSKAENTIGTYALFADAYREAAKKYGVSPNQFQAAVWIHWRNLGNDARFQDFSGDKKPGGGGPSGGKLKASGLVRGKRES